MMINLLKITITQNFTETSQSASIPLVSSFARTHINANLRIIRKRCRIQRFCTRTTRGRTGCKGSIHDQIYSNFSSATRKIQATTQVELFAQQISIQLSVITSHTLPVTQLQAMKVPPVATLLGTPVPHLRHCSKCNNGDCLIG